MWETFSLTENKSIVDEFAVELNIHELWGLSKNKIRTIRL